MASTFQIVPVQGLGPERLIEIQKYLVRTFRDAVTARTTQIDSNYKRWLDNYNAIPAQAVRSTPWVGASNFMPQLSRMHTDILSARINGIVMGTKPFWRPSTMNTDYKDASMRALARYMENKSFYELSLFPKVDELILEVVKTGTVTQKARWKVGQKYSMNAANVSTPFNINKLTLDNVPFYDFFPYPLTAPTLDETLVRHSRIRLTKEEVEFRRTEQLWAPAAVSLLLQGENKPNEQQVRAAQSTGISLTPDTSRPYTAVESSFDWELEPGKMYPLVAVFNPQTETADGILRLFHSYYSDPTIDMYVDWRIIPRTDSYYGIGVPEILEGAQEEQAQIHNTRRDASTVINIPSFVKKRYSLNNFSPASEYYPGKVWEVDNVEDVKPLQLGVTYNSMMEEENMCLQLAERYTGVSAPMQGMGTGGAGKKGNYASQGTLALLAEGNRRLDIYIKRLRAPFHRLGKTIFTSYRDFGDRKELEQWGNDGQLVQQAFDAGGDDVKFRNMFFDFSASDAAANKEVDRSSLTIMANTMAAYYGQCLQLAQAAAGMPDGSPAKVVVLAVLDGAHDLAERLLTAFDISDRKSLLPDVRALLAGVPPAAPDNGQGPQPPQPGGAPNDVSIEGLQALLGGSANPSGSSSPGVTQ